MLLPPALRPGDRVALVAPAGPVDDAKVERAVFRCEALGLEPVLGAAARDRAGYLAGPDAGRAADLRAALEGDLAGVWALRGGYGTLRILDAVGLTGEPDGLPAGLRDRPRAFIGFSDNTAVHLALTRAGLVSFHGPHAGYEHFSETTEAAFRSVLMSAEAAGTLPHPPGASPRPLVGGVAEGPLVGGNLALLAATCGTPYQLDARGGILFIEDVGEPIYRIDRMLVQLRLAGVLDGVAGLAVGSFTAMPEPVFREQADADGVCLERLLAELAESLGVPAVMGLPFGHGTENWTLPMGVAGRLDASAGTLTVLEPAVA